MADHRRSNNNNGNIISGQDLKGNSFNASSNNHSINIIKSNNENSFNIKYFAVDKGYIEHYTKEKWLLKL